MLTLFSSYGCFSNFLSSLAWLSKLAQLYCCKKHGFASIMISSESCVSSGVPFLHAWNRTCSEIWNMLSDNVINTVNTSLMIPWDPRLIFIKVVITLGAAPVLSLSIFINCISQPCYDGKELPLYEIFHFASVEMFWSLNGAKKMYFTKATVAVCLIQLNSWNWLQRWCFEGKWDILAINVLAICWNWSSIWRWNLIK